MAALIIEKTSRGDLAQRGARFELLANGAANLIGRDPRNYIAVEDRRASRVHCAVTLRHGTWWLEDRGSRNGTRVKGRRVERLELSEEDAFRVGSTSFRFTLEGSTWGGGDTFGCRLERACGSDGGVLRHEAWQLAMDRRVLLDFVHPAWPLFAPENGGDALRVSLTAALETAEGLAGPGIARLLNYDFPEELGGGMVLLEHPEGEWVGDRLTTVLSLHLVRKLCFLESLFEVVLKRSRVPPLRYPVGLGDVWLSADGRARLAAFDLGAFLAHRLGFDQHTPTWRIYLAPESGGAAPPDSADGSRARLAYNLGALAYHVLCGEPPCAGVPRPGAAPVPIDILAPATPVAVQQLVAALLDEDPGRRPAPGGELLEPLRAGASALTTARARAPAKGAEAPAPPPRAGGAAAAGTAPLRPGRWRRVVLWIVLLAGLFFLARWGTATFLQKFPQVGEALRREWEAIAP